MASAFGHALAGFTIGRVCAGRARRPRAYWIAVIVLAILPDLDVLSFSLGIPYSSPWGHRGFTHSLLFAALVSGALALYWRRREWWSAFFFATVSHGVLDAMTTGGEGVGFLIPFNDHRYFLPWRPIRVSPIGVGHFFNGHGQAILANEALYIGIPCLLFLAWSYNRRGSSRA